MEDLLKQVQQAAESARDLGDKLAALEAQAQLHQDAANQHRAQIAALESGAAEIIARGATIGADLEELEGRLDTLSAPALMELLDKLSQEQPFKQLVFDLEKLEYLSSTGLRVFLMMAKRVGSDHLFVDNANALVREIFDTTGFSSVVIVR